MGSLGKAIAALLVAAIVVTGIGAYFILQALSVEELNYTESFSEEGWMDANWTLRVTTVNGYIKILGWDNDLINMSGVKRASTQDGLEKLDLQIVDAGFNMEIWVTNSADEWGGERIDLDIKVPSGITIAGLHSTNGEIDVRDVSVIDEVQTTNGAIDVEIVETDGDVELSSTNGRIDCRLLATMSATVDMTTLNGDIDLNDVALALTIDESRHKRGALGSGGDLISISTVNGAIRLHTLT